MRYESTNCNTDDLMIKNDKRRSPIINYIAEAWERRPNHTLIQLLDELNIIPPQFDYLDDQRILDTL
jgi:hypothetical protein